MTDSLKELHEQRDQGLNTLTWVETLERLHHRWGDEVLDELHTANDQILEAHWKEKAELFGLSGVESLLQAHWEKIRPFGFEFTQEESLDGVRVITTRCPVFELFRSLGKAPMGYHLVCHNDFAITRGFDPTVELTIESTMMQGAEVCRHLYRKTTRCGVLK